MKIFLRLNGYRLNTTVEEIIDVAVRIAGEHVEEGYTYDEFVAWVRGKLTILTQ